QNGLVEFEHDVAHETVTDHDVDPAELLMTAENVATFDVPDVVEPGRLFQRIVRGLDLGGALSLLFADVQETHRGILPVYDPAHVDRAQVREADDFSGRAVEIRAGVEHQHRALRGGQHGADRGPLDARMETEENGGRGENRAGIAGRHEGVDFPRRVE